jgi:cytochrome c
MMKTRNGLVVGLAVMAVAGALGAAAQDRAATGGISLNGGERVFVSACSVCHSVAPGVNKVGPSLHGVVGRRGAALSSYFYSEALRSAGLTWSPEQLDVFLTAPQKLIPGTRMVFSGIKDAHDRAAVIDYLKTR